MTNRVYLYCTNVAEMPHERDMESFFSASGKEYEAAACIPLYWLLMFEEPDIKTAVPDDFDLDLDARPYPYLLCKKKDAIARLASWQQIIEDSAKAAPQLSLYSEWIGRVGTEPFENVIVRTEELSWFGEQGELEKSMRSVFQYLHSCKTKRDLVFNRRLVDLIGLWNQELLADCESYQLVGQCNGSENWPPRFIPPYQHGNDTKLKTSKWWKFWKKTC